ncbi:putative ribonuclease H-like domain-containing protein [Tanacetum coccineum]
MKSVKNVTEEEAAEYEKEKEELRSYGMYKRLMDMQAFLRRLDRQDLNDLYKLVQERFQDHPLEGHDLLLWGDLRMLFDPDEKDELWMNQLDWKLLKWKLYESCGVHTLFMDGTPMEINMIVEKKYLLIKELFEKMLNLQLEAEEESIENLIDLRVKVIRCDNGNEFKNRVMNQFCEMKGIKREFSIARTPQQNRVAERKTRILIEAARTMLADSKLPTTLWANVVNTACYVQNKVLVIKPHNKTSYELFLGRKPALSFMRPFGCPVTILNTIDHLGKFDGKADEGFFVGYSTNSKAFRVFNNRTRIVEENLHVQFSENIRNITGSGPNWLFNIDALTNSINYKPVVVGNHSNGNACTKAYDDAGKARVETDSPDARFKPSREEEKKDAEDPGNASGNPPEGKDSEVPSTEEPRINQEKDANVNNTNNINIVSPTVNASIEDYAIDENIVYGCADDPNIPDLEEINRFSDAEDDSAEADMTNLNTHITVYRNKKDKGGIVIRNKARLVAQGHTQEEGIDYDEVFALVARIEAIGLFLAYALYKDFMVYQIDVKSAFLYGKIEEEVYVCQPSGFEDPDFPDRFYKVEKALCGLHQAPRAWYETLSTYLLGNRFQRGQIDKTLFIKMDQGDILIVQVYVDDIIFGSTKKKLCPEFKKMMHKKF